VNAIGVSLGKILGGVLGHITVGKGQALKGRVRPFCHVLFAVAATLQSITITLL